MTRKDYRELFDKAYARVDDVFKEEDARFVVDQLIMFFGFSDPQDFFVLPKIGRLTLAVGNFDEAFRVGGFSEFLENCGYCIPDVLEHLRMLDCFDVANVLEAVLTRSDRVWWGGNFFGREFEVTEFCRANNWFRTETE